MVTVNRSLAVFLGTVALGSLAAVLAPGAMLRPGELLPGHAALRDDCLACHELLRGVRRERCTNCHAPEAIGVARADRTAASPPRASVAALHRSVGSAECALCHAEHAGRLGGGRAARFAHEALPADTRAACGTCHADDRPADALHAGADARCGACHATDGWKPATFDHARHFRFDRHHPPRCTDCHAPGSGFETYSCTGCHEHALARIEAKHREEGVDDVSDCARCHPSGDEDDTRRPEGTSRSDHASGRRRRGAHEDEDD